MLCRIALWDCLWKQSLRAPRVRESGFRNLENFCPWNKESKNIVLLMEWRILGFEIRRTALGIPESYYRLTSGIQVPLTKNPESSAWNPEPKTGLDCLPWGKTLLSLAIAKLRGELGQNLAPKQFHTAVRRPSLQ